MKSEKGVRKLALGGLIESLMRAHREAEQVKHAERGLVWSPSRYVFTSPICKPLDPRRDHDSWEGLLREAGVPDARLHVARHTTGTMLVATGTGIREVQEILGHSDIRVTELYVDIAQEAKREAVDRVAAALLDGSLAALLQPNGATTQR